MLHWHAHAQCTELTGKLAEDLAAEGLQGRTVTLKLKTTAFALRTRAVTLPRHVSSAEDLLREALKLLRPELPITIRLMVSLSPPALTASLTPLLCLMDAFSIIGAADMVWLVRYISLELCNLFGC